MAANYCKQVIGTPKSVYVLYVAVINVCTVCGSVVIRAVCPEPIYSRKCLMKSTVYQW